MMSSYQNHNYETIQEIINMRLLAEGTKLRMRIDYSGITVKESRVCNLRDEFIV